MSRINTARRRTPFVELTPGDAVVVYHTCAETGATSPLRGTVAALPRIDSRGAWCVPVALLRGGETFEYGPEDIIG